jgi:hypothetical protein
MDIASLIENLSEDDMKKLRETASAFFGGGLPAPAAPAAPEQNALPGQFSPQLLQQAAKISSALSQKDPRSDFILALKPLLRPTRQKKADEAAMMVRLFAVLGAMKEGS